MSTPKHLVALLINNLDSPKTSVAGDAITELRTKKCVDELVDAILCGTIRTARGRIRATNILQSFGKSANRALEAYVALLNDRSFDVAQNALFGIVFWQDKSLIEVIDGAIKSCKTEKLRKALSTAKKSLNDGNPFLYSKSFHDVKNVWQLDPKRFARRIGEL